MSKMNPEQFRNRLQEILELAFQQGSRITKDAVDRFFAEDDLSPEQLTLVYDFLLSRKVVVDGYDKKTDAENSTEAKEAEPELTEEEQRWLASYLEDLDGIRPVREEEWVQLAENLDSPAAKRRVSELMLPEILELAKSVHTAGIHLSDLVQEGSLGLIMALESLDTDALRGLENDAVRAKLAETLLAGIREDMQALIEEQADVHTRDRKFVEKVEDLKDGVSTLKEEYGRKVYLDEVADFMSISEEEAAGILRLAGEEVPEDEA